MISINISLENLTLNLYILGCLTKVKTSHTDENLKYLKGCIFAKHLMKLLSGIRMNPIVY